MGKFGPTALNFGYDIFLLITFLGHLHVSLLAGIIFVSSSPKAIPLLGSIGEIYDPDRA